MSQYMLNKINSRHRAQGAWLLKICHSYNQAYQNSGSRCIIFTLDLATIEGFQPGTGAASIHCLDVPSRQDLYEELEGRLRSRCGSLLELELLQPSSWLINGCFCDGKDSNGDFGHNSLIDARVYFMHRSVFEFLSSDGVWKLACLQIIDTYGDVATALSIYYLQLAMQCLLMLNRSTS